MHLFLCLFSDTEQSADKYGALKEPLDPHQWKTTGTGIDFFPELCNSDAGFSYQALIHVPE